jgi:hypothetical protein
MKNWFLLILLPVLVGLSACSTVPSTTTVSARVASLTAQLPNDLGPFLGLVVKNNPKYKADILLVGQILPTLAANGPITSTVYLAALSQIPGITPEEKQDLSLGAPILDSALQLYEAWSGKTVALYTDPNVQAIVDAFAATLVKAAS